MRLYPRVTTAATVWPIDLDAAKRHLVVEHDEDNTEITEFLQTAFDWLQPPLGCLRVSIAPQTLRLRFPAWPVGQLELPAGPVASITSIKYFDPSNVEQTIDPANYFLDDDTLCWAETFAAPSLYARPGAVRISYLTGYAADKLPATVRLAVLQCVAHWFENREAVQAVGPMALMPLGVDDLIASLRMR